MPHPAQKDTHSRRPGEMPALQPCPAPAGGFYFEFPAPFWVQ